MTGAPTPPVPRLASVQAGQEGSGIFIDHSYVLTADSLFNSSPAGAPPPRVVLEGRGHSLGATVDARNAVAACLRLTEDTAYEAARDQLPSVRPGFVVAEPGDFEKPKALFVWILGYAGTAGGRRRVEIAGQLRGGDEARACRERRGYGELAFVANASLPAGFRTLLGAPVWVSDPDKKECLIGLVTGICEDQPIPQLLVTPFAMGTDEPNELGLLRLLDGREISLERCTKIEADVITAAEVPGDTVKDKRAFLIELIQSLRPGSSPLPDRNLSN